MCEKKLKISWENFYIGKWINNAGLLSDILLFTGLNIKYQLYQKKKSLELECLF